MQHGRDGKRDAAAEKDGRMMKILGWIIGRNLTLEDRNAFPHSALRGCGNEEREEDRPLLADRQLREKRTALFLPECGNAGMMQTLLVGFCPL